MFTSYRIARTRHFLAFSSGALAAFAYWQLSDVLFDATQRLNIPVYGWLAVFAAVPFLTWFRFQPFAVGWVTQFIVGLFYLIFLNPFAGFWMDNLSMYSFARSVQLELPDSTQNFRGRTAPQNIFVTRITATFEIPEASIGTFFNTNGFIGKPDDPGCWSRSGSFDLDRPEDVEIMKRLEERFQGGASRFLQVCLSEPWAGTVRVRAKTATN